MDCENLTVFDCIIVWLDIMKTNWVRRLAAETLYSIILLFYNLTFLCVLAVTSPLWLWRKPAGDKKREGLGERLGRVPHDLAIRSEDRSLPVIWLHAVSVGEVLAVSYLVSEFDWAFPGYRLLISTTTETGHALAQQRFGTDRVFYCPIDVPWAVTAYFKALQPRMLALVETEFWPNLLSECFERRVPVAVINARISDRSYPRYRLFKPVWEPILSRLSLLLAQSPQDAERLKKIGCRPERILVTGNLKFDVRAAHESNATTLIKDLARNCRFLVAGSTIEGEEALLLEAWPQLLSIHPDLVMVIAPRHPERFHFVSERLDRSGFKWVRRSHWDLEPDVFHEPVRRGEIVLLDTIGELASIYSVATVAFVGGSLVPSGGHNPLEPAQFGVPIVMGPYYQNFRTIVDDLVEHKAICIAKSNGFHAALIGLFNDAPGSAAMGKRAWEVFNRQAGATGRTIKALHALLKERIR
jgi:3-deoxy-D-manno-octulosonic-acid transferase